MLYDHVGPVQRPASVSIDDRRMDDLWVPETVKQRFEAAGRALMALPLPQGALPGQPRSSWPAVAQRAEDAFAAMIGASEEIRRDFSDDRHRLRLPPSARALADMDESLQWLWYLGDPRKRRLCLARSLRHPVSDRYIVSYRRLGKIFGLHHDTVRVWHDRALGEIAQALNRCEKSKTRRPVRRHRNSG